MTNLIEEINQALSDYNQKPIQKNKSGLEHHKELLRHRIAPCSEFSSLYRACLRTSYEDWALQILEENLDLEKHFKSFIN